MSGSAENVYDVIVIGAGPVGYTAAGRVAGPREAFTGTVDAPGGVLPKSLGVDLIRGHGRLDGHRQVATRGLPAERNV
ncbi:MAG TPA: hypothetical protein VF070_23305 [Streptosporangiaceae bacterium]